MRAQLTLLAKDGHKAGAEYAAMLKAADTNGDHKVDDTEVNDYLDSLSEAVDNEKRIAGDVSDQKVARRATVDVGCTLYIRRGCPYCCRILLLLMEVGLLNCS